MPVHVEQPPVRQTPNCPQPAELESRLSLALRPPLHRLMLGLASRLSASLLARHPPSRTPTPVRLPVDRPFLVGRLAEHPHALRCDHPLAFTTRSHCRRTYAIRVAMYSATASAGI